ncbi:1-acyl-sn-glycerol-3-phosphate acyltransferase [Frankia sp. Mgl5]|uniref:lysophospholipid acyltransferase family protein n=1 Tax=Frankia sp. Mgl5 TaxID=2933793 RepID=UPI00200C2A78|nr:lysophospholipid acyltransferase family protein [Frankia sp. Mgl5]MCK9928594.1 1-acyl-sn-glycerol-3-phosphate acyltransferase [Frankia sp. Mgl5]
MTAADGRLDTPDGPVADPVAGTGAPVESAAVESAAVEPAAVESAPATPAAGGVEPAPKAVEPTPSGVESATSGGRAERVRPATSAGAPAHRGAASKPFNDITHRVLKPPVRQVLNHLVMNVVHEGWENVPHGEPLIFAGNHSSWMDGPLVVIEAPRTVRCLVKSEMYKGILGRLLLFVGQIPINRGRPDRDALHTALDELSRGGAIGVFPEGTRGSGEMAAVQHGIAYLAVHGRCRVLPVACINTGAALPRGAKWPRRSVKVRVVFGKPFEVEVPANPRSRRALAAVAEDIRVRLADHLATVRAGESRDSSAAE